MKKPIITLMCLCSISWISIAQDDEIKDAVNDKYFGVPSSPAFELLPDKPTEVTHIMTGKDWKGSIPSTIDGRSLKSGFGFDGRWFVSQKKTTLAKYQKSTINQIWYRTVWGLGSSAIKDSEDIYLSTGLKIPIIDKSDPRAKAEYVKKLEAAAAEALEKIGPPKLNMSEDEREARNKMIVDLTEKAQKEVRENYVQETWNAFRLDFGLANMWRVKNAYLSSDSIQADRFGLWLGASLPSPLIKEGVIMIGAKNAWIKTGNRMLPKESADSLETGRMSVGVRYQYFANFIKKLPFAISVEYARIISKYDNLESLDEQWNHLGVLLEVPIPKLKGIIGLAYGGDSARREDEDSKFEFNYSIYTDKLLKK